MKVPRCRRRGCSNPRHTQRRRGGKIGILPLCRDHWAEQAREKRTKYPEGARIVRPSGYVEVKVAGRLVPEHRLVMEGMLGRALRPGESVRHRNGRRDDNGPENLELWVNGVPYQERASDLMCPHCGVAYLIRVPPEDAQVSA